MSKTNGNAFVYVLIAVTLLGLLTYVLASSDSQTPMSDRDEGVMAAQVAEILAYSSSVSSVYSQMEQTGTDLDELDLTLPSAGAFNTAPNNHKLFHPDGGGLAFKDGIQASYIDQSCGGGWGFIKDMNWGWSKTAAKDFFASLLCLKLDVCKAINKKLTGSETVPTASIYAEDFIFGGGADFVTGACPVCEKHPSLCIYADDGGGFGAHVYYSLIKSR